MAEKQQSIKLSTLAKELKMKSSKELVEKLTELGCKDAKTTLSMTAENVVIFNKLFESIKDRYTAGISIEAYIGREAVIEEFAAKSEPIEEKEPEPVKKEEKAPETAKPAEKKEPASEKTKPIGDKKAPEKTKPVEEKREEVKKPELNKSEEKKASEKPSVADARQNKPEDKKPAPAKQESVKPSNDNGQNKKNQQKERVFTPSMQIAKNNQKPQQKPQRPQQNPQQGQKPRPQGGVEIGAGASTDFNGKPKARVFDTRSGSVDLSKYDEKFENISNKSGKDFGDTRGGRVVDGRKKGGKFDKEKDKERIELEKLRKQQMEKARRLPVSVSIPDEITVGELASRLKITASDLIKKLFLLGVMANVNQTIDFDTAYLIADELGAKVTKEVVVTIEEKLFDEEEDDEASLITRAPVVCVMGHVDHGKTSLLDAIRHTKVTQGEAGGITQHIGAYRVTANGKDITFLDTPGHEAFTSMRARGAKSTDIAILVVAADDGIMPQTVEAINHAKAAEIDIIVAINKMDKPSANPDMIKQALTQYELVPEEWGGDVMCVPVSALTGKGIDTLLENVLFLAEFKDFKANPNRRAKGVVIEAKLDKGRGPVATVLVQNGTLKVGDTIIAGTAVGRVKAMKDDNGKHIKSAGPSVPVEIDGLSEVPSAGDEFNAVENERMARELAEQRREKIRDEQFKANAKVNLEALFDNMDGSVKDLNVIVKADVTGSAEAVKQSLLKLSNDEVKVNVIHSAAGGIVESDVMLASASNAIIVGFNVRPDKTALESAEKQKVDIRTYRIIYDCIEEITAAMKGMLAPTFKESLLGHAEVRQAIRVPSVGIIAGCYITDGKVTRNCQMRILRDSVVLCEDKLASLRRFKDDVKEVNEGYECGVGIENFNDIREGDILEFFEMVEVER